MPGVLTVSGAMLPVATISWGSTMTVSAAVAIMGQKFWLVPL